MDYDEDRIYYSYQNLQTRDTAGGGASDSANPIADDKEDIPLMAVRRHFREFLRKCCFLVITSLGMYWFVLRVSTWFLTRFYNVYYNNKFIGMYRQKQRYVYRDRLLRMHQRTYNSEDPLSSTSSSNRARGRGYNYQSSLTVDLAHVGEYDPTLLGWCLSQPAPIMPVLEIAAVDALKTLLVQQRSNDEDGEANEDPSDEPTTQNEDQEGGEQDPAQNTATNEKPTVPLSPIQILLRGNITPTPLRSIQSTHMNTLLSCTGIIISASRVRSRATSVTLRCTRCQHVHTLPSNGGPFSALNLPRQCLSPQGNECGLTPYAVVPDDCGFVDQQTLKLQEAPEAVPTGEMPRSVLCAVERNLVDKAPPGTRVRLLAIVSLLSGMSAVKTVYLRIVGMVQDAGVGRGVAFTPREEEAFRRLARRSDVYDILARSMAPSISGNYTKDIKKALTCQLFSGSRKRLPDGMALRGDINVLLLGDPSMAKSQFLKYVTRVAPVGVYTSGKGSSAAGLTASVVRDSRGEFYLEGGAMVLADGGIVAIDEFDKMRPADRVAIHEAMEQQTISVAKAGITTVLNSRSSVLAAANPVFGRYDDMKSASENIDLMTTILSRFDLIFLVRDVRDEELDKMICHHVMGVHINNSRGGGGVTTGDGTFGAGFNSLDQDAGGFFDAANG
jgi:DNA replication licensing factor MCM5